MANVYEIVTEKVLAALESGVAPWRKTWRGSSGSPGLPASMSTRRPYRGANVFLLWVAAATAGYSSRWWGTYEQVRRLGGQVRKGERSTLVTFWRRTERKVEVEDEDEDGGEEVRGGFVLRYFAVFNEQQADWPDGSPFAEPAEEGSEEEKLSRRLESAEEVLRGYRGGPPIAHGGDVAAYNILTDTIRMPGFDDFESPEAYYSTCFHEVTHSTGHAKRLGREGVKDLGPGHGFGSESYAREELVAEMGAAFLCAEAGIENAAVLENSAAYLRNWASRLRSDPRMFVTAAAQAQKAADHVLGRKFEQNGEG